MMDLAITLPARGDLGTGVYRALRDAIEEGRAAPGERLPSTRELARQLGVARNTVAAAYDALVAEGYAEGRVGSGTYVLGVGGPAASRAAAPASAASRLSVEPEPPVFDLRLGTPDPRHFPAGAWRRALADGVDEAVREAPGYGDPAGDQRLRASIARHVSASRGVRAQPDRLIVTAGAQGGFGLLARTLVAPGDIVAVEDPGYPPARQAFAAAGATLVGVPVDQEGLVVEAIPPGARLVVTTPAHQLPMGVTLSGARRAALMAWAERSGGLIVEDDYDSEFRYTGRPLEPLQRLDRSGRVVYVGSFSKTLLPMLRLGFLVAPIPLLAPLLEARRLDGFHADAPSQFALRRFIDDGTFGRHLRRQRRLYRGRHDRLVAAVSRDLAPWLVLNPAAAGLHIAALAGPGVGDEAIRRAAERAEADGVAVERLDRYAVGQHARAGLALGFGRIDEAAIDEAVRRLARAFANA